MGGEAAQPYSWSWLVSIQLGFLGHTCGGSLINAEWVLTAAHCALFVNVSTVHIGVHSLLLGDTQRRTVIEVIRHPDFVAPPAHINDIALLRLASPVDLSTPATRASLTCLPAQSSSLNFPNNGQRLAVVGWGVLAETASAPSPILQQVRVITLSNNDPRCVNITYDQQRQFCAMVEGGGKDACQGKSIHLFSPSFASSP